MNLNKHEKLGIRFFIIFLLVYIITSLIWVKIFQGIQMDAWAGVYFVMFVCCLICALVALGILSIVFLSKAIKDTANKVPYIVLLGIVIALLLIMEAIIIIYFRRPQ